MLYLSSFAVYEGEGSFIDHCDRVTRKPDGWTDEKRLGRMVYVSFWNLIVEINQKSLRDQYVRNVTVYTALTYNFSIDFTEKKLTRLTISISTIDEPISLRIVAAPRLKVQL